MSLSRKLNCRVQLFGKVAILDEYDNLDYEYRPIKKLWAEISPRGGVQKEQSGNTVYADISHKIIVRDMKGLELTNDMYFMFRGQRYDIKYFNPNYRLRDRIEILCNLVVE